MSITHVTMYVIRGEEKEELQNEEYASSNSDKEAFLFSNLWKENMTSTLDFAAVVSSL